MAFTGMTTTVLATVAGVGAVLLAGGALLVRRSSRRQVIR
ncbi:MAG: LPXTG cell wall anchor domain-containing protein [Catenulispora sp.]|nr:LPXTG cell wall anchor domain-containing protein [Catenulispora sp.]